MPLDLIDAGIGWGAQRHETEWSGAALSQWGLIAHLQKKDPSVNWCSHIKPQTLFSPGKKLSYLDSVKEIHFFAAKLAAQIEKSVLKKHFPIVLGGDHTIALGTWSGIVNALSATQALGLIWIDAHMDAHTLETTASYAIHGMPLAILMGYGEPCLVNLCNQGAKLNPGQVVIIGVRSFEPQEAELLAKLNVKIYFMDEVKERGFHHVFKEALAHVEQKTKGFGVSIDLDAFDPQYAPGVGSPVKGGILPEEVYSALALLKGRPTFKALEIAEYNPSRDIEYQTAKIIEALISNLL